MEDEKFLGEPSNCSNNNNSTSTNIAELPSNKSEQKPSSSSLRQQPSTTGEEEGDILGDDDIGWYCTLCTFKNSVDKFKCEVCDLRRPSTSTSTRKPRCSADTIVAQVVKQQEQIRQQTRVKPPKVRAASGLTANSSNPDLSSPKSTKTRLRSLDSKNRRTKTENPNNNNPTDDDSGSESASSAPKLKKKRSHEVKTSNISNNNNNNKNETRTNISEYNDTDNDDDSEAIASDVTVIFSTDGSPSRVHRTPSESSLDTSHYSSSSAISPEPTTSSPLPSAKESENPFKISSLEVTGNLIKYSPPTSSGRTGLIIDKKRFTQHSVTVNDVTITFTEFATRQNKYVRKKKKRRDFSRPKNNHGNGKSRPSNKNDSRSNSNNASSTSALGDT